MYWKFANLKQCQTGFLHETEKNMANMLHFTVFQFLNRKIVTVPKYSYNKLEYEDIKIEFLLCPRYIKIIECQQIGNLEKLMTFDFL